MSKVFDCSVDNISLHLKNIFNDKELNEISVAEESSITASDGKKYKTKIYNLDAIIAVGYRINSKKATEFRIWATKILKDYMTKGFALNDERFIKGNKYDTKYFDELLERIKTIRVSERMSYQKIIDLSQHQLIIILNQMKLIPFLKLYKINSIMPSPDIQRQN